ncbi:MAG TPA: response regulator transcription factor, partial [Flavobacteriales bacterium]|nr:response regulator transcription factor [Flavobacteriales bacterium]
PDIVIMDIDMPFVNGIEGLRRIKETRPETAVVMHTVFEDDDKLFSCLCAGANGYLLKNSSFIQLLKALEEVQQGGAPMSPSVATRVLRSFQLSSAAKNKYELTKREVELLQFLVKGYSYKMIASALFISLATVQSHVRNIYAKLHVNCGREAVVVALREKIV